MKRKIFPQRRRVKIREKNDSNDNKDINDLNFLYILVLFAIIFFCVLSALIVLNLRGYVFFFALICVNLRLPIHLRKSAGKSLSSHNSQPAIDGL